VTGSLLMFRGTCEAIGATCFGGATDSSLEAIGGARYSSGGETPGSGELYTGSGELYTGRGELYTGSGELYTGSGELYTGSGELFTGSGELYISSLGGYTGSGVDESSREGETDSGEGYASGGEGNDGGGVGEKAIGTGRSVAGQDWSDWSGDVDRRCGVGPSGTFSFHGFSGKCSNFFQNLCFFMSSVRTAEGFIPTFRHCAYLQCMQFLRRYSVISQSPDLMHP